MLTLWIQKEFKVKVGHFSLQNVFVLHKTFAEIVKIELGI